MTIATEEKRRGSNPAPVIDTLRNYSVIPFLQHPSWWSEAERLSLVFRQTKRNATGWPWPGIWTVHTSG
jgi:hypothetical protein